MSFNPAGTHTTANGKPRKGIDVLQNFFNPMKLGGIFDKKKVDSPSTATPPTPGVEAAPKPEDAKEKARLELEKKRRMSALSGGKTILTSAGSPTGSGGKTLLGA